MDTPLFYEMFKKMYHETCAHQASGFEY